MDWFRLWRAHSQRQDARDDYTWQDLAFTVLDLETSGLEPRRHHIVQIGAVRIERQAIPLGGLWSGLINGEGERSIESLLIHEISPDWQLTGREQNEVVAEFAHYAQDSIWVAWDADFDLAFLDPAWRAAQLPLPRPLCLDLAELAACLLPDWHGRRRGLDDCLVHCKLPQLDRHDALGDALASAQLLQMLMSRASQSGILTLGQVRRAMEHQRARRAASF